MSAAFMLLLAGFSLAWSSMNNQADQMEHGTRALLAVQKVRRGGTAAVLPCLPGAREMEIEALRGPSSGLDRALNRLEVEALRSLVEATSGNQVEGRMALVVLGLGTIMLGLGLAIRVAGMAPSSRRRAGRGTGCPGPATPQEPELQAEDDLQGLVEALPVAAVVADPSGRVVLANSAAESLLGAPLVGRLLDALPLEPGKGQSPLPAGPVGDDARGDRAMEPLPWQRVSLEASGRIAMLLCHGGPRQGPEVKTPARANPPGFKELTAREQEIFGMIIQGLSNREIGEALVISEGTVKSHVNRLLRKLDLRDRVHVLLYAAGHGMLIPQSGRSPS